MAKILILSTAHATLGDTGASTGVWLEELAAPFYALKEAGHTVTLATLGGAPVPIDPNSDPAEGDEGSAARFKADADAMDLLRGPADLSALSPADFDAVFVPGGHGAVWDLASSDTVAQFLSDAWAQGKVLASVCHGPAALVGVTVDGVPLVKGMRVSAFTDSEERGVGLQDAVPFLLESRLRDLGANVETGPDMQSKAVADGRLITGQNPMSSDAVAKLLVARLAA